MGNLVTATKTPVSPPQMLEALGRAWMRVFNYAPTRDQLCVLLAHWALETGNGGSMMNFNVGNARCPDPTSRWDYCQFMTWEIVSGAKVKGIGAFRAFDTLEDGCADYLDLMHGRFLRAWPAVEKGDPVLFAHVLKQLRYYTAPESTYAAGLKARYATFKMLPETAWETEAAMARNSSTVPELPGPRSSAPPPGSMPPAAA